MAPTTSLFKPLIHLENTNFSCGDLQQDPKMDLHFQTPTLLETTPLNLNKKNKKKSKEKKSSYEAGVLAHVTTNDVEDIKKQSSQNLTNALLVNEINLQGDDWTLVIDKKRAKQMDEAKKATNKMKKEKKKPKTLAIDNCGTIEDGKGLVPKEEISDVNHVNKEAPTQDNNVVIDGIEKCEDECNKLKKTKSMKKNKKKRKMDNNGVEINARNMDSNGVEIVNTSYDKDPLEVVEEDATYAKQAFEDTIVHQAQDEDRDAKQALEDTIVSQHRDEDHGREAKHAFRDTSVSQAHDDDQNAKLGFEDSNVSRVQDNHEDQVWTIVRSKRTKNQKDLVQCIENKAKTKRNTVKTSSTSDEKATTNIGSDIATNFCQVFDANVREGKNIKVKKDEAQSISKKSKPKKPNKTTKASQTKYDGYQNNYNEKATDNDIIDANPNLKEFNPSRVLDQNLTKLEACSPCELVDKNLTKSKDKKNRNKKKKKTTSNEKGSDQIGFFNPGKMLRSVLMSSVVILFLYTLQLDL